MRWSGKVVGAVGIVVVIGAIVVAAAIAMSGGGSSSGSTSRATTVKTGRVLGKNVIVTPRGRTLYSLSAETHGRFICTDKTCLSLWKPLVVARGTKPTGAKHLGTIRRPDGRTQVTYEGKPVYTFVEDRKPGDHRGEGFKDVGTWHVASGGSTTPMKVPTQTTTTPGYGY